MKRTRQVLCIVYIFIILYITIFSRSPGSEYIFKPLFWEYKKQMWHDITLNILLFVPFGILVDVDRLWKRILCGFLLSVSIETIQYFFMLGYCEPDDVLNNTIGTALGCLCTSIVNRVRRRQ